jgi:hypothetical protein
MKRKHVIHVTVDGTTLLVQASAMRHDVSVLGTPICADCGNSQVKLCSEAIQWGAFENLHMMTFFCYRCGVAIVCEYVTPAIQRDEEAPEEELPF